MDLLDGAIRHYEWGSVTAIPDLLGRAPTGEPVAELWLGAHPSAPSLVGAAATPLDEVIAADPVAALGDAAAARFGELPFLFKVLAADSNLSLQAHPSAPQARAGFAAEEARGIPRDAAERNFPDPNHKPELICALGTFDALCGFRALGATRELFATIAIPALDPVRERLSEAAPGPALAATLEWLLRLDPDSAATLVDAVGAAVAAGDAPPAWRREWALVSRLAARYPRDAGVIVTLLLNLSTLERGEALFLGAGNLHAYLGGTAVELMANSDNVIRGGLTPKHVDVATLLEVVDTEPSSPHILRPPVAGGVANYEAPVAEFGLSRIELDGAGSATVDGPSIVLCVEGMAEAGDPPVLLERGAALWVPVCDGSVVLDGTGTLFRAGLGAVRPLH